MKIWNLRYSWQTRYALRSFWAFSVQWSKNYLNQKIDIERVNNTFGFSWHFTNSTVKKLTHLKHTCSKFSDKTLMWFNYLKFYIKSTFHLDNFAHIISRGTKNNKRKSSEVNDMQLWASAQSTLWSGNKNFPGPATHRINRAIKPDTYVEVLSEL